MERGRGGSGRESGKETIFSLEMAGKTDVRRSARRRNLDDWGLLRCFLV